MKARPKSWLNLCDRPIEARNDSSAAEPLGLHALISGRFANKEAHFVIWGIPLEWPSIVILVTLTGCLLENIIL